MRRYLYILILSGCTLLSEGKSTPALNGNGPDFRIRQYTYYYYPAFEIYYQTETGNWFYREGESWIISGELPKNLEKKTAASVTFKLTSKNPVIYHKKIKQKYPGNKFKSKQ